MKLLNLFKRKAKKQIVENEIAGAEVMSAPANRGGVRKTKHKQFSMDESHTGGRVVKTMPRSLRHMKELAEKTDD